MISAEIGRDQLLARRYQLFGNKLRHGVTWNVSNSVAAWNNAGGRCDEIMAIAGHCVPFFKL